MGFLSRTLTRIKTIPTMMKDKSAAKWKKALVIFGIVYLFLPIDIIPPFLLPIGFIDDLILWLLILWILGGTLDQYWMRVDGDNLYREFEDSEVVEGVDFEVVDETADSDGKNEE